MPMERAVARLAERSSAGVWSIGFRRRGAPTAPDPVFGTYRPFLRISLAPSGAQVLTPLILRALPTMKMSCTLPALSDVRGQGETVLSGVIAELTRYTQKHFAFEESWMKRMGPPTRSSMGV
jgi:hypothetical protein